MRLLLHASYSSLCLRARLDLRCRLHILDERRSSMPLTRRSRFLAFDGRASQVLIEIQVARHQLNFQRAIVVVRLTVLRRIDEMTIDEIADAINLLV